MRVPCLRTRKGRGGPFQLPVYPSTDFRLRNNEEAKCRDDSYNLARDAGRVIVLSGIARCGFSRPAAATGRSVPGSGLPSRARYGKLVEIVPAENHYLYKDKPAFI